MYRTVDIFIRNADYPNAIREHIKMSLLGESINDFTVYEQRRLEENAVSYCDRAMRAFLTERAQMEEEFC